MSVNGYTGTYDAAAHGATRHGHRRRRRRPAHRPQPRRQLHRRAPAARPTGPSTAAPTTPTRAATPPSSSTRPSRRSASTATPAPTTRRRTARPARRPASAAWICRRQLNLGASFTDVPGGTAHWTFAGGTNYTDESGTAAIVITKADAIVTRHRLHGHLRRGGARRDRHRHRRRRRRIWRRGLNLGASFTDVPGGTAHWTFAGGTNYTDQDGTAAIVINQGRRHRHRQRLHRHLRRGGPRRHRHRDRRRRRRPARRPQPRRQLHRRPGRHGPLDLHRRHQLHRPERRRRHRHQQGRRPRSWSTATPASTTRRRTAPPALRPASAASDLSGRPQPRRQLHRRPRRHGPLDLHRRHQLHRPERHAAIVINQAAATVLVNGYTGIYDAAAHGATGTATGVGGVDLRRPASTSAPASPTSPAAPPTGPSRRHQLHRPERHRDDRDHGCGPCGHGHRGQPRLRRHRTRHRSRSATTASSGDVFTVVLWHRRRSRRSTSARRSQSPSPASPSPGPAARQLHRSTPLQAQRPTSSERGR